MMYQCGRCGLTRASGQEMGVITQCKCPWEFVPPVAPQRTWVNATTWRGLTEEDKKEYIAQDFGGNRLDAMDWAEKRLKEKNTK